jgi:hypothetical protein
MNVTFHTLASFATAAVLSSRLKATDSARLFAPSDLPFLAAGFASGVLVHGLLDYAPHAYPIKSAVDVLLSLALFSVMLLIVRRRYRLLLGVCFLGGVFPDLIDLGPAIVNKHLGWSLPMVKIFPWHWREYSGSIYDGSRGAESFLYHLIVAGGSLILLYAYRRQMFRATVRVGYGDRI